MTMRKLAIDVNSDPLMFWKNSEADYPHLAKLANTLPSRHPQLLLNGCSVLVARYSDQIDVS